MFLNRLNVKQKENFIELAYMVAGADGNYTSEEKKMMEIYKHETELYKYSRKNKDLDKILSSFNDSVSQNILLVEIMGLILSDSRFHVKEKEIVTKIISHFGISREKLDKVKKWVLFQMRAYKNGEKLIYD
mgnify:CR=1 FL=1